MNSKKSLKTSRYIEYSLFSGIRNFRKICQISALCEPTQTKIHATPTYERRQTVLPSLSSSTMPMASSSSRIRSASAQSLFSLAIFLASISASISVPSSLSAAPDCKNSTGSCSSRPSTLASFFSTAAFCNACIGICLTQTVDLVRQVKYNG